MDTLTHALSGALLARASGTPRAPARSLPRRIAAGFFACAAPDLDFVVGFFGPVAYLELHRGPTHSFVLLPFWAFVFAWVLSKILREPGGWRALYGVTALGLALHILGDLITGFGTMMFWPVSDWRAALGTTFIIDLWFSGIILAGLLASAFVRRSRVPALVASATLLCYVGFQYVLKQHAIGLGEQYAREKGLQAVRVEAHPRPVSPFNWTVFVSDEQAHRYSHVNLVRAEPRPYTPGDGFIAKIDSPYLPVDRMAWVTRSRYGESDQALIRDAWESQGMRFFRWFADLPAFDGLTDLGAQGGRCAWFADLRFLTPGRDVLPFQYGACRDSAGAPWQAYERLPEGRVPLR